MARRKSAADYVADLKNKGYSQKAIAQVLGVNDSYISQVARGKKSGEHYREALKGMWRSVSRSRERPSVEKLAKRVARPERRRTRTGELARVRKRSGVAGARFETHAVGPAGAFAGARSLLPPLRRAAARGWNVAFTVWFKASKGVDVGSSQLTSPQKRKGSDPARYSPSRGFKAGHGPELAADFLYRVEEETDGDVTAALLDALEESRQISFESDDVPAAAIEKIEMRTFAPR